MKLKKTVTCCGLLLASMFSGQAMAAIGSTPSTTIDWNVEKTWDLPAKPLDIVYSLDGKLVFILTDKQSVLVYDNMGEMKGSIPVDKGVSAIDIAPRGERLFLINQETKVFSDLTIDFTADINTVGSPFRGLAKAPVTIVLFTDYQCPYCSKISPILEQVLKKNPDTVKIVLKNLPLGMHQFADPAARAALAAGEQGKYWEFHDALFALPALNDKAIDDIAVKLGLKMVQFKSDMASPKIRQKVDQDIMDAQKAGVTGTPSIFINGHPLRERTLEAFQQKIDAALGKTAKK